VYLGKDGSFLVLSRDGVVTSPFPDLQFVDADLIG
jgi:hypothetical protein